MTERSGTTPRWSTVWLPVALIALVAVVVATGLVVRAVQRGDQRPGTPQATGVAVAPSGLAGEWSGIGTLTDCAGFEDCAAVRSIVLRIDCSTEPCVVTPFDRGYGRSPLRFADGRYRAAGPVPPEGAPTCGGTPTRSALWRLDVVATDGQLQGSYAEATVQGFDCGATWLRWAVTLERG